ncbi:NAD(P)-dependent alcohol dehydrogenase [Streptomyces sp. NBC_00249]|uniref:NAD(P)-dependent alcohol dehydrogenase n=1 Tax=Streptomyces sp. NBC_00249 TaxID=2975690 RepID=UPI00225A4927|nr:NAD(P)-dependent alcohol dehydrogenase [Streptomyces sp. NBC_00249]MCX5192474.1 NAD(P)-dependent alcohol dehydrogenase [Streptomyces sp. NBC_00249]
MKAIAQHVYGSCEVLELTEIERPSPGPDEVLIRVRAAAVDAGVWHLMTGMPYLLRLMGYGLRAPKVPVRGREVAGVVEAAGAGVTRFRPGDEVFGICEGSFAEYALARPDKLAAKPAGLPLDQAAALPVSGLTALQALRDAGRVRAGQRVLVIGAGGGVGSLAVQLAKAFGAHVTGVCGTGKTDLVRALGADEVVDRGREEITDGRRRYDLVVDTAGNRPLSLLRRALTPRGTLVIVGGEGGGRWLGGTDRVLRAGLLNPFVRHTLRGFMAKELGEDLDVLRRYVEAGELKPVIDRTYDLPRAADAITRQHLGRARGKILLVP